MASMYQNKGTGNWIVEYKDHAKRRHKHSTKTTNKKVAQRIKNKIEADVSLRRDGVIDARQETINRESRQLIQEQMQSFADSMRVSGCTSKHVDGTIKHVGGFVGCLGWASAADIKADDVNRMASKLHKDGKSPRTIQSHLTSIKSFTKWMVREDKLSHDPLAGVKKPNPESAREVERRFLLHDEWNWLKRTTEQSGLWRSIGGPERAAVYAAAIQTGLRANELRSLTRGSLRLNGKQPHVMVAARAAKNRRQGQLFITQELAGRLSKLAARKKGKQSVFDMPNKYSTADMLRHDLDAARQAWLDLGGDPTSDFLLAENYEGKVMDFHALRHTCGAWLSMQGAHPSEVQRLMRHSTITLTMDTYGHLFPGQEAETAKLFDRMGVEW